MNPRKLIAALIIGIVFIAYINNEFSNRDKQLVNQNNFMANLQKELKKEKEKNKKKEKNTIKVTYDYAVAAVDIKKGDVIEMEQVNIMPFKKKQLGAISDTTKILGKLAFKDLRKGDLIKTAYIGEDTTYKIPVGMRAINIPITKIEGFSSLVHKHKRVDIVTSTKTSKIILENVMIVSINKNGPRKAVNSITLEIPASASADLIKAINIGKIHLVVRGKNDNRKIMKPKKKARAKVETKKLPKLPEPTPMPNTSNSNGHTMTMILGNDKKQVNFN